MHSFKLADPESYKSSQRTLGGNKVILVAVQKSRRRLRKGKTKYIWHRENTNQVYWNRRMTSIVFLPMARLEKNMKKNYETFVNKPTTQKQKEWLSLSDYELVE